MGIVGGALRAPRQAVGEIGLDLEELPEVGVVFVQQVVEQTIAEQHDLDLERQRFRLDRDRRSLTEVIGQRIDADLAAAQAALQCLPGEGLGQHLERIEEKIAAVRPVERARPDQGEIGHPRTQVDDMLDPAHQIGEGAMVEEDDGWSPGFAVVHHQVHLVAPQRAARVGGHAGQQGRRLGLAEERRVLDHVRAHLIEIGNDLRQILEARLHLVDEPAHGVPGELPIQRTDALAPGMGPIDLLAPGAVLARFRRWPEWRSRAGSRRQPGRAAGRRRGPPAGRARAVCGHPRNS